MSRVLALGLALSLCGCAAGGPIALQVLAGLASAATIASDVAGIDVSLAQKTPGKTPIGEVIGAPPAAP